MKNSQRDIAEEVRQQPRVERFSGQRISSCAPDDPEAALVPDNADAFIGLVTVLCRWAGERPPDEGRWRTLLDEARAVGRRDPKPPERLSRYLRAVAVAASEHPYPAVEPNTFPPALSVVHLCQSIETREQPGIAEDILAVDDDCLTIGGPGMGKSSLLRLCALELARGWSDRGPATEAPVQILAADLLREGSPGEVIDAALARDLHEYAPDRPWTAEMFAAAPRKGARWLLLVDGLDELVDDNARRKVVTLLATLAKDRRRFPYRTIVTSRLLHAGELDPLLAAVGWWPRRFELQPFTAGDIATLALGWFQAMALDEPEAVVERFVDALARMRLTEFAGTPLIASIMCQLHAIAPDDPLPRSRGETYYRFTDQLHRRLHHGVSGAQYLSELSLEKYGQRALAAASTVLDELPRLITEVAVRQRAGDPTTALDIVATDPRAVGPERVPVDEWRTFLDGLLRRSGLLHARMDDFVFVHQSFADYLIARYHRDRAKVVEEALGMQRIRRREYWSVPAEDPSLLSFVLDPGTWGGDDLAPPADVERLGLALTDHQQLKGCQFLAAQRRLGTGLPGSVLAKVGEVAEAALASESTARDRVEAARILADLDRSRGLAALEALACEQRFREWSAAVREIASLDIPRAIRVLSAIAAGTPVGYDNRVDAAWLLTLLDQPRGHSNSTPSHTIAARPPIRSPPRSA